MKRTSVFGDKGFTLIELLIVIAIIGFLAAAILVAVDPVRRIQDSRNAKRWQEINAILNAVLNNQVDNRAQFTGTATYPIIEATNAQIIIDLDAAAEPSGPANCISAVPTCTQVGATLNVSGTKTCYANLHGLTPDYIAQIPLDPSGGTTSNTGYYMIQTPKGSGWGTGRIEIGACAPDLSVTLKVKR